MSRLPGESHSQPKTSQRQRRTVVRRPQLGLVQPGPEPSARSAAGPGFWPSLERARRYGNWQRIQRG